MKNEGMPEMLAVSVALFILTILFASTEQINNLRTFFGVKPPAGTSSQAGRHSS
jgi:hypothetical protein